MLNEPVITSISDQDFYKFSMAQFILHRFPQIITTWRWKNRSKNIDPSPFIEEIKEQIYNLENIVLQDDEYEYLKSLGTLSGDFIDYLRNFKFRPREQVEISLVENKLNISFKGPWLQVTFYEIPILAIVSEITMKNIYRDINMTNAHQIIQENIELVNKNYLSWMCFGTRRRFSKTWQEHVTGEYSTNMRHNFIGTSNVYFAKKFDIKPKGTMAHEIFMAMQSLMRIEDSERYALEQWVQEFRGDFAVALTDIFGIDFFLKDFDLYFAKVFDGVRHDSGNPFVWCEKIINHYRKLGIDPLTKTAVFSDGLTFEKAFDLHREFRMCIQPVFGIGTNSTNDLGGNYPALQQVCKMVMANNHPVAKVSDSDGKGMCEDSEYERYVNHVINKKVSENA